jgi:5-carboxymethyl-2-hydroxymuconate isomerase
MRRVKREELERTWRRYFNRALPEKIVCVGLNYVDHAAELSLDLPSEPLLFGKFPNALVDPGEPIVLPAGVGHVDAEAELAIVIGRRVRAVAAADALDVVAGYLCANDVSARDLQFKDGQWLRAKGFDTFCPISTEIVPVDQVGDARGLRVVQRLNGVVLQDSSTDEMIFGVPEIVAHASTVFTLEAGDVILTGTPAGVGVFRTPKVALAAGDVVEVEVERIGTVASPVVTT